MALVTLPSVIGAKSLEDVIDAVENMRKTVEFLLENVQDDNINGVISPSKISIGAETTYAEGYDPSLIGSNTGGDGQEFLWFYNGVPGSTVDPEKNWTDDTTRNTHVGDLYYDLTTKYCYRYKVQNTNVFSWERLMDSDIQSAMDKASGAQDTADHKRRVFVSTPVPPYDVGDLWAEGGTGDLKRCNTARKTGDTYNVNTDFDLATKYTDDTVANSAMSAVNGFQTQIDGKVEVWYYAGAPTASNVPASSWTDTATKNKHVGDLYYDTNTKYAYRYKTDYTWEKIQDQDINFAMQTAGTKKRIFTTTPTTPYDKGDLWVGTTGYSIQHCTTARASGDFSPSDWTITGLGTHIDQFGVYTGEVVADQIKGGTIKGVNIQTTDDSNSGKIDLTGSVLTSTKYGTSGAEYVKIYNGTLEIKQLSASPGSYQTVKVSGNYGLTVSSDINSFASMRFDVYETQSTFTNTVFGIKATSSYSSDVISLYVEADDNLYLNATNVYVNNNSVATQSWANGQFYKSGNSPTFSDVTFTGSLYSNGGTTTIYQSTIKSGNYQFVSSGGSNTIFQYSGAAGSITAPSGSLYIGQNTVTANSVGPTSNADYKKNIQDWNYNATDMIVSTPIRQFQYKYELDEEFPHVGIIVQESPVWAITLDGKGIDLYEMSTLGWKSIQELNARIANLESKIV